jgi:hypothetical protein
MAQAAPGVEGKVRHSVIFSLSGTGLVDGIQLLGRCFLGVFVQGGVRGMDMIPDPFRLDDVVM